MMEDYALSSRGEKRCDKCKNIFKTSQTSSKYKCSECYHKEESEKSTVMLFTEAPMGCRFKYYNQNSNSIWIKLSEDSCGLIAEYNEFLMKTPRWIGQKICSFADTEGQMNEMYIEVIS